MSEGQHEIDRIVAAVAAGDLSPEEAAVLLDALSSSPGGRDDPLPRDQIRVARIEVQTHKVPVAVIGDERVTAASVTGSHRAHHEGDALVVTAEDGSDDDIRGGFVYGPRTRTVTRAQAAAIGRAVSAGIGAAFGGDEASRGRRTRKASRSAVELLAEFSRPKRKGDAVEVAANPDLPLTGRVVAAQPLTIEGMRGDIDLEVVASNLSLDGADRRLDLRASATVAWINGALADGATISAKAATIILHLDPTVRYHLTTDSTRATVRLPDHAESTDDGGAVLTSQAGEWEGSKPVAVHLDLAVSTVEVHHR